MKFSTTILCLLFTVWTVYSQKEDRNWVFGINCGIDFNDLSNPTTFKADCNNLEANASISDSAGNLLFYLAFHGTDYYDPMEIRDSNNQVIINGDSIFANFSSTNGIIILPFDNKYYIFYLRQQFDDSLPCFGSSYLCSFLYYSVVEKNQIGNLEVTQKNVLLLHENTQEKIEAIKHANGNDWWLITNEANWANVCSNKFFIYKVTANNIKGPYIQNVGPECGAWSGEIAASPDGSKLAFTGSIKYLFSYFPTTYRQVEAIITYDFDRCTGILTNPIVVDSAVTVGIGISPTSFYGLEFSPDGNYLYVSGNGQSLFISYILVLFQYNLQNNTRNLFYSKTVPASSWWPQFELGPDNKIYCAYPFTDSINIQHTHYLGVVNYPNNPASSIQFQPFAFFLGDTSRARVGLPNMPNYNLGAIGPCGPEPCLPMTLSFSMTQPTPGLNNGAVKINVSGGDLPYLYSLDSITFQSSSTYSELENGTYHVYVTDSNGCAVSDSFTIGQPLGIDMTAVSSVKVYPSPTKDYLNIDGIKNTTSIQIFDLLGKKVLSGQLVAGINRIEIKDLTNGVYIYRVSGESKVGKIFIEK